MAASGGHANGPCQSNQLINVQSIKALFLIQSRNDQLRVINTVKVNVKRKVPSGIGNGFIWACPINLRRHKSVHPDRGMSGNSTRPATVDGRHDSQRTFVSGTIVLGDAHRTSPFAKNEGSGPCYIRPVEGTTFPWRPHPKTSGQCHPIRPVRQIQ